MVDSLQLSVIVPIYNEDAILWENMEALAPHFDKVVGKEKWQYVLVDNGSKDGTAEIIKKIKETWPKSTSVYLETPNYGNALRAGLENAQAPWAHIINVEQWDIPFLTWGWSVREEYDLLIGSKRADPTLNHQSRLRWILSWGLNSILQLFFDFVGNDSHGPKYLNMKTLKPVLDVCTMDRGQYDTEIVLRSLRAGMRMCEAPVVYEEQRSQRNPIFKKITWNMLALNRLRKQMKTVPYAGPVRLRKVTREDVLQAGS